MTPQDLTTILAEIKKLNPRLNDWERQFLKDMENRPFSTTAKQDKCLLTIYEKATGGGLYQSRQRIR